MSKMASKERLAAGDISTPAAVSLSTRDSLVEMARQVCPLGFPLIIKPDNQGCSLGVNLAQCLDDLPDALSAARRYGSVLLAERFIRGREMTVTVLDRTVLPVLEIEHDRDLFDFGAKFDSDVSVVREADREDPSVAAAAQAALAAVEALDTRGLARVDLIVDAEGQAWVLEINTIPGMTHRSLAPRAALLAGWEMPEFCERLVRVCLAQHEVFA
jgi:D-alanine-D-alanine ligase